MANAAGHKFGQDLGKFLEEVVLKEILRPRLLEFTQQLGYYLDYQKRRPARRGKKVIWKDKYGNDHSLDFVVEEGGTEERIGRPIAFIESAWRRYTKHSKNKAQEIQGAVLPIVEKHILQAPFVGVVLAGEFTAPSLQQLASLNFAVLHIPYRVIVESFREIGVELEFDEETLDAEFRRASADLAALTPARVSVLRAKICTACDENITSFMERLHAVLRRHIVSISLIPAWGVEHTVSTLDDAKSLIAEIETEPPRGRFLRFEINVRYSNGDVIKAEFSAKAAVVEFLDLLDRR